MSDTEQLPLFSELGLAAPVLKALQDVGYERPSPIQAAAPSPSRLQKRMDPRRQNGGIFLGLNGTVVKSHGSADATGISAAIKLAAQLGKSGFQDRLAARVAQSAALSAASTTNNLASDSEGTS